MNKMADRIKVTEAAAILGVNRATVLVWIDRGILRAFRAGERCMWLIDREDVDKVLVSNIPLESAGAPNDESNTPHS